MQPVVDGLHLVGRKGFLHVGGFVFTKLIRPRAVQRLQGFQVGEVLRFLAGGNAVHAADVPPEGLDQGRAGSNRLEALLQALQIPFRPGAVIAPAHAGWGGDLHHQPELPIGGMAELQQREDVIRKRQH